MENQAQKQEANFIRLGIVTIAAVYLLILVGGIVRSTGSGMGCPDWPKCFGSWVPPTEVTDLPSNYQEIYAGKRAAKNEKFSRYLEWFGFNELADNIRNDESILLEPEFNSTKTWIEYFNRLLGAVIGLLIFATFIASFVFLKKDKKVPILAFLSFVLVVFQGWIGSIVVSTNLLPWMITVHMLLALLLVALLIYLVFRATPAINIESTAKSGLIKIVLLLCLSTLVVQIAIGTQVREAIDEIALAYDFGNRALWVSDLGSSFLFHRSFSLLILGLHVWLFVLLIKNFRKDSMIIRITYFLLAAVGLEIGTGIIMAYFAIPSFIQPVHLLLSSLIFGAQFVLLLMVGKNQSSKTDVVYSKKEAQGFLVT